jgi:hypothetical protein
MGKLRSRATAVAAGMSSIAVSLAVLGGPAMAATPSPSATSGVVEGSPLPMSAPVVQASMHGIVAQDTGPVCNNETVNTCMDFGGDQVAGAATNPGVSFPGHLELTGPHDTNINSGSLTFGTAGWVFTPGGGVCGGAFTVTTWRFNGGTNYTDMGSVSQADNGC